MRVLLLVAVTVDGMIAREPGERSFDWTSPEDKQFYIQKIKEAGCVVMGSQSFKTFSKYPKGLTFAIYTRQPAEFHNPRPDVITAFGTNDEPTILLKKLAQLGHKTVAICGGASIYGQFLAADLVDTLYMTVEPIIFGAGVKFVSQPLNQRYQLKATHQIAASTIVLEYGRLR